MRTDRLEESCSVCREAPPRGMSLYFLVFNNLVGSPRVCERCLAKKLGFTGVEWKIV